MNEHAYLKHSSGKIVRFSCNWWPCMKKNQYNLICAAACACVIIHKYEKMWMCMAQTSRYSRLHFMGEGYFGFISGNIFFLCTYLPTSYFGIHILLYLYWMRTFLLLSDEFLFGCFRAEQESSGRILCRVNWWERHSQMGGSNYWAAWYAIVSDLIFMLLDTKCF